MRPINIVWLRRGLIAVGVAAAVSGPPPASAQVAVTTYHNDTLRTGLNAAVTTLTTANVAGSGFGLQHAVTLDDQVDAQPLFVSNQRIAGQSVLHDVVYVATEGNTVYAIDAATGAVLR